MASVFALRTLTGLVHALPTTVGLIPIFGADVLLHALTASASAYFGWTARAAAGRATVARRAA
jgi:hypothetical protein